jgi:glycosyltransferase involved in cell wall biosynthesis
VVDDGSSDNSSEVLNSYGSAIKFIRQSNAGQAAAINNGFEASRGEIICLLDGDDSFLPQKIEKVVSIFDKSPRVSWIFHGLTYIQTATGEVCYVDNPAQSRACDFRGEARRGTLPFVHSSTSGMSFRRNFLEQLLPVPEEIRIAADNYLKFAAMALSEGFLVAEPLSNLRIHGGNAYTMRRDNGGLKARTKFLTAKCLRQRWPDLAAFSRRVAADGLSELWCCGRSNRDGILARDYIGGLPLMQRCLVRAMAAKITVRKLLSGVLRQG